MMIQAVALLLALAGPVSLAHAQDASAGKAKAVACIGCHGIPGYQASFPVVYKVPMISGQNAAFLVASLAAYKKGERKHPTMRAIAASMTDQDMADVAAFYQADGDSSLKNTSAGALPAPTPEVAALLAKGACASCHGPDYNKPISAAYPKLAGQHNDFLYFTLRAYSTENNPQFGRANAIMSGQVKQFKMSELKAMADYLGSLPGDLRTVPQSRFR